MAENITGTALLRRCGLLCEVRRKDMPSLTAPVALRCLSFTGAPEGTAAPRSPDAGGATDAAPGDTTPAAVVFVIEVQVGEETAVRKCSYNQLKLFAQRVRTAGAVLPSFPSAHRLTWAADPKSLGSKYLEGKRHAIDVFLQALTNKNVSRFALRLLLFCKCHSSRCVS